VYLLVDQMIETASSRQQMKRTSKGKANDLRRFRNRKKSLGDKVASVLMEDALRQTLSSFSPNSREVQILGTIHGHLSAALPDVKVEQDPLIQGEGFRLRPDIVAHNGETVVIEVKRFKKVPSTKVLEGLAQLERYLETLGAGEGVLYLVPSKGQHDVVSMTVLRLVGGRAVAIHIVTPSSLIENFDEVLAWPGWEG